MVQVLFSVVQVLFSVVQVLRHGTALSGRGAHHGGDGDGGPDRVQVQYSTVQCSTVQYRPCAA